MSDNIEDFLMLGDDLHPKRKTYKKKSFSVQDVLSRLIDTVDVSEDDLNFIGKGTNSHILELLLIDRTRGAKPDIKLQRIDGTNNTVHSFHHIVWGTDNYKRRGENYRPGCEIQISDICYKRNRVIRPRAVKSKEEQLKRIKQKAEVFTPAWVCNAQNNLIDEAWFGRKDVFNREIFDPATNTHSWISTEGAIEFSDKRGHTWLDYVTEKRLEITCGEAPYLVSRYDATNGNLIPLKDRIGLLDRKLRVVGEHAKDLAHWREYAYKAIRSVYGFEYQGDNLLLARENILATFVDYYYDYCKRNGYTESLSTQSLGHVAFIISWNIFQMDGLNYIIPYSDQPKEETLSPLLYQFEEQQADVEYNPKGIPVKIAAWKGDGRQKYFDEIIFRDLLN